MTISPTERRAIAARALALVDLTNLSDSCDAATITALARRAQTPHGNVAALCVWPQFVKQAGSLVAGTGINIATVVNFPHGEDPVSTVIADACKAVCDGATEIDLVWPYKAFVRGQESVGQTMIEAVRTALPENVMLKVILETGEISDPHQICRASQIALTAGADMLKTSTGKVPIGATLDAANGMLSAIRDTNSPAGFKASGGIGTLEDAAQYLELADKIMGPEWSCPQTFRFGASSLVGALLSALGPDNHA